MKKSNLCGASTRTILRRFSNTAAVEVRWNTAVLGRVDHDEIKLSRLVLGAVAEGQCQLLCGQWLADFWNHALA
ncbi:MAG: hypothetical protein ABR920_19240 [Terriglobales bacterium]|jgi:hypothetical protein